MIKLFYGQKVVGYLLKETTSIWHLLGCYKHQIKSIVCY